LVDQDALSKQFCKYLHDFLASFRPMLRSSNNGAFAGAGVRQGLPHLCSMQTYSITTKLIAALILFFGTFALNMALPFFLWFPLKWMWNSLAPMFGLPSLDYYHALALLWLIAILRLAMAGVKLNATLKDGTEV
jgi:hypothetical protein